MAEKPCMVAISSVICWSAFCTSSSDCPSKVILALTAFIPPTKPMLTFVSEDITAPKSLLLYLAASVISTCCCWRSAICFATRLYSTVPCSNWDNWSRSCLICCRRGTNDLVKFSTFFCA